MIQGFDLNNATACGCIGPQRSEPLCPCAMRSVIQRDGRWIKVEQDLGPVVPHYEMSGLWANGTMAANKARGAQ